MGAVAPSPPPPAPRLAGWTLAVLTAINFVNYLDRYVLGAVLEPMRLELGLSDVRAGALGSVFMIVYMVAAPVGGFLGDRVVRTRIVAAGVFVWSLATLGSGLARDYPTLVTMRALVGLGEAGYAAVAPAMIADLYAPDRRGRMLARFYLAIPAGSALGYLLGGFVGARLGWRAAFFVAAAPGLVLAAVCLGLPEPVRGARDGVDGAARGTLAPVATVRRLLATPAWVVNTTGTTLMTFAMGGLAFWMPTFLQRVHGMGLDAANLAFGAVTVVAGLAGTLLGGWLGDRAQARRAGGYLAVSGWGLLLGAPFAVALVLAPEPGLALAAGFVAELLLFLNTGPLNAAMVACVPAGLRASAFAVQILIIHALGDALSPTLMGWVSAHAGLAWAVGGTAVPVAVGGVEARGFRIQHDLAHAT